MIGSASGTVLGALLPSLGACRVAGGCRVSDSAVWWASHALSSSVRPHKGAAVGRGLAELLGAHSARVTDAGSETEGSW